MFRADRVDTWKQYQRCSNHGNLWSKNTSKYSIHRNANLENIEILEITNLILWALKRRCVLFKGQMNQNLNIFSLAILKRRNVKQNIQKETYAEIFLYEP